MKCAHCDNDAPQAPFGIPLCRWCYFEGRGHEAIHASWLEQLKAAHVKAEFEHTGGGCWVLRVPVSEDGKRFIWLGWGPDDHHDMLAGEHPPQPGDLMMGCVYEILDDDEWKYSVLENQLVTRKPDAIVSAVKTMAIEAMSHPSETMVWV